MGCCLLKRLLAVLATPVGEVAPAIAIMAAYSKPRRRTGQFALKNDRRLYRSRAKTCVLIDFSTLVFLNATCFSVVFA
jgi:hypothetical protein